MSVHYILTDYIDRAISEAEYDSWRTVLSAGSFLQRW